MALGTSALCIGYRETTMNASTVRMCSMEKRRLQQVKTAAPWLFTLGALLDTCPCYAYGLRPRTAEEFFPLYFKFFAVMGGIVLLGIVLASMAKGGDQLLRSLIGNPVRRKLRIGVHLQTLTPDMAHLLGMDANAKGAEVFDVEPDSLAAIAGLRIDDVIVELDHISVASAAQAVSLLHAGKHEEHLLRVWGGGLRSFRFITIPAPQGPEIRCRD